MRHLVALAVLAAGCYSPSLDGERRPDRPTELASADDRSLFGPYRPDDVKVHALGSNQFQVIVQDEDHLQDKALRFAHRRCRSQCPAGFDVVSSSVSFKQDHSLIQGDHQDVVVATVIRCHVPPEPDPTAGVAPIRTDSGRQPVSPQANPGTATPPPAASRRPVVAPDSPAPGPASP